MSQRPDETFLATNVSGNDTFYSNPIRSVYKNHTVTTKVGSNITGGIATISALAQGSDVYEAVYAADGTTALTVNFAQPETFKLEGYYIRKLRYVVASFAGSADDVTPTVMSDGE